MTERLLILTGGLALVTGVIPWWLAWRAWRRTSLRDALLWLLAAGCCWVLAAVAPLLGQPLTPWRFLALTLTGCYLTAVLGARRPGMMAWNFVTVGLLAVLLLPMLEQSWHAPRWHLDEPRTLFLSVVLGVGLLNYLPTRFCLPIMLVAGAFTWEVIELTEGATRAQPELHLAGTLLALAAAAWWAWLGAQRRSAVGVEEVWLRFRDGFGAVWALRAMEQFNAAARHADWPLALTWFGVERQAQSDAVPPEAAAEQLLRTVLKRFLEDQ